MGRIYSTDLEPARAAPNDHADVEMSDAPPQDSSQPDVPQPDAPRQDASQQDAPQADAASIRCVLDYGTKNQSATSCIMTPNSSAIPSDAEVSEAPFPERKYNSPQIMAFYTDENGKRQTAWGTDVISRIQSGELQPEQTIEMWKIANYKVCLAPRTSS